MREHHVMSLDASTPDGWLFVCPHVDCNRRVVFKRAGGMVVIERGLFGATHSGAAGLLVDATASVD